MEAYREKLIMTYKEMINFYEELLTRIINVGMTGEWAEVNKVFKRMIFFNLIRKCSGEQSTRI